MFLVNYLKIKRRKFSNFYEIQKVSYLSEMKGKKINNWEIVKKMHRSNK